MNDSMVNRPPIFRGTYGPAKAVKPDRDWTRHIAIATPHARVMDELRWLILQDANPSMGLTCSGLDLDLDDRVAMSRLDEIVATGRVSGAEVAAGKASTIHLDPIVPCMAESIRFTEIDGMHCVGTFNVALFVPWADQAQRVIGGTLRMRGTIDPRMPAASSDRKENASLYGTFIPEDVCEMDWFEPLSLEQRYAKSPIVRIAKKLVERLVEMHEASTSIGSN